MLGRGEADAAERERYAALAVETLARAIAVGYADLANMRRDTDLDAIRDRDDVQKLLADLKAEPQH